MSLYREVQGSGPDLLLVHGWGMHGAVWSGLAQRLAIRYRVTLLDLPGHGHSPPAPGDGGLDQWVCACLEAAPARAVWIGWSLGGALALAAALGAPERVRGLFLVTATPRFLRAPDWPHAMGATTLERFHQELSGDAHATLERFLVLQVSGSEAARTTLRGLRQELASRPAAGSHALEAGLRLLRDTDLRGELGRLACPNLWLFGDRDTLVPGRVADALPAWLPSARTVTIPGAAHAPFLSHPRQSWDSLNGFLEGL